MNETLRNNIENLLREKKKTKRDLAKLLKISENSVNRTLNNSNISLSKLEIIADFLEVGINDLLPKTGNSLQEQEGEYQQLTPTDKTNQLTISNLSEALKRSSKTIDNLVLIIAENFPHKKDSAENILIK